MATSKPKSTTTRKTTSRTTAAKKTSTTKVAAKSAVKTTAKTARSTASKTTASKSTPVTAKATSVANAPEPMVVNEIEAVLAGPVLRKKALIDEVTQRAGIKRRDAKPAVDAVLAILGEALVEGRELNLPPMGKIKIRKTKKVSNGTIMQARIRQPEKGRNAGKDPLAEAAE